MTRDVDLLVQRQDLQKIVSSAESAGYAGRKMIGGFMLIRPGQQPEEAVHLLFASGKARSSHPLPNPVIHPEEKHLPEFSLSVPVAPLRDLIQMKLNSFRAKDEAHLEILDKCGLLTPSIESDLPAALKDRLAQARKRFSTDETEEEE